MTPIVDLIYEARFNENALYSIKGRDLVATNGKTYPSLKKAYLAYGDPLDINFALDVLGDYETFLNLSNSDKYKDIVSSWKVELATKIKSEALKTIITLAKSNDRASYNAARFLLEGGWIDDSSILKKPKQKALEAEQEEIFIAKAGDLKVREDFRRLLS